MTTIVERVTCGLLAVLCLATVCQAGDETSDQPRFRFESVLLNPHSEYSACCVFDVNGDGRLDIYCGGFWYQAPDWQRHVTREVTQIRGRYDDYANLPLDVNGDGWIDVVSVNYRSKSIYWCENPRGTDARWQVHMIDEPGPSETGILADVDSDGLVDILPNGTSYAAWYRYDRTVDTWFDKQPLPAAVAGHGLGFGDLDEDGVSDFVTPQGWWKQVRQLSGTRWLQQDGFKLHRDACIPILVRDVDEDGDADVIWSRAHNVGLYWMEQVRTDGKVDWQLHAIDTSYSSAHCLLWADLDGDRHDELIVGRRYLGHDGKDPGEWMPLGIYAYTFKPETRTWYSEILAEGSSNGFDLGAACADLDADGDLDIVAPTRVGLRLLLNQQHQPTMQPPSALTGTTVRYDADEPLLKLRNVGTEDVDIETRTDWGRRRAQILASMQQVMGAIPSTSRRVDLDVQFVRAEECDGYQRHLINYQAEPGSRVSAYLLIPNGLTVSAPAMLCLHPTHRLGKGVVCGLSEKENRSYAHELAQRGYICLAPDYPSFGDDADYDFGANPAYSSGTMKAIWNNIRAVDFLETLPQVDRDRIGCIGHSLGGHNGLFTAAFDLRIRAVVTSCGFTAFANYYGGDLTGWTSPRYMPKIREQYQSDPRQMPFDFHEVIGAIAPRPVFISAPLHDDNFEVSGVHTTVARVRPVYDLFENAGALVVRTPDGAHDFLPEIRGEAYDWLSQHLKK
ncbi:MAG: alpha/beta fold hydrolase [Planctomycetales bacterium]|nr:alpha/beta fold hydrolase [Planctomycetales bacterium]